MRAFCLAGVLVACGSSPLASSGGVAPSRAKAEPPEPLVAASESPHFLASLPEGVPASPSVASSAAVLDDGPPTPWLPVLRLTPEPPPVKVVAREPDRAGITGRLEGEGVDGAGARPLLRLHGAAAAEIATTTTAPSDLAADAPQYREALVLLQRKKPREALEALAAFVLRQPGHPKVAHATLLRGDCYVALGERERAEEHFRAVVRRFSGSAEAHEAEQRLAWRAKP